VVWSQCLFYALDKWSDEGGRVVFRKSTHWPVAHVQYTNDHSELTHFVPGSDLPTPIHSLVGFYGEVLHHDMEPCKPIPIYGILVSSVLLFCGTIIWAISRYLKRIISLCQIR